MVVVDHHDRRTVAGPETLHRLNREEASRIDLAHADPELAFQLLDHALRSGDGAGQGVAHLQHELAHRISEEHDVIRDHVFHIGGCNPDHLGNVTSGVGGDVALLLLRKIESVQHGRLAMLGRVVRRKLLEALTIRDGVGELRALGQGDAARAMPRLGPVRHYRMKAHRSTSPMTTSNEPITAITSAIMPPTMNLCSAWQAISPGDRMWTRHGRLLPSETM